MNTWRSVVCVGTTLILLGASVSAGPIYQVKDINPGPGDGTNFKPLVELDGRLIFWGYDGVSGTAGQPWISDGTLLGTQQIAAIVNGGALPPFAWTASNGRVYFVLDDGFTGLELWSTDGTGTAAGTLRLTDIAPGSGGNSDIRGSNKALGGAFFVGASAGGSSPDRVWKSDGTVAGTAVALTTFSTNYLTEQATVDGRLAFFGGSTLMLTDGSDAGTTTYSGSFSAPDQPVAVNDAVYFYATTAAAGQELWRAPATGTPAASLVTDIVSGSGDSSPQQLTRVDDRLFFTANFPGSGRELWVSNGTGPGTTQVLDINPGIGDGSIRILGSISGVLYFAANDGSHGQELWRSDGSAAGTMMVKDIAPNGPSGLALFASGLAVNRELFFVANDGSGATLWMSDGTPGGTRVVDPSTPFVDVNNTRLAAANGRLFLEMDSGAGRELHAVDLLPLLGTKWCKTAEQPLRENG